MNIVIGSSALSLSQLRQAWAAPVNLELGEQARRNVAAAQAVITEVLNSGQNVYGVNTGFGQLANVRISDEDLTKLQENLVSSHAVGVGPTLPDECVRLILLMKISALAQGNSGVRIELIEALCALVNHEVYPCVPSKGSVGASGDLAPLAHLAGVLIGMGQASHRGKILDAHAALEVAGISPLTLAPKEGLALLNGTQVSTAIALTALFGAENVLSASLISGSLTADAIKGSDTPFDARIHLARGQPGQVAVAGLLLSLMEGSDIRASHLHCDRVQDPYSIRCQPQVAGACVDALDYVAGILTREANAVTDNPLVFADSGDVLSGGNFHAEPVAFAADHLALSIAETASLSERRIALLVDTAFSGLPPFLVADSGLNSGFMIAQVTAAALASENKALAHPHSVDSIPTSANQEDHVSMATASALRLHSMLDNASTVVAIELLAAVQGIEFHRPKRSSERLEEACRLVRQHADAYERDRSLSDEIQTVAREVLAGCFTRYASALLPSTKPPP